MSLEESNIHELVQNVDGVEFKRGQLTITNAQIAGQIFNHPNILQSDMLRKYAVNALGDNAVVLQDDENHTRIRSIMNQSMSMKDNPEGYLKYNQIITQDVDTMIDKWLTDPSQPIDLENEMGQLTMSVAVKALFGYEKKDDEKFTQRFRHAVDNTMGYLNNFFKGNWFRLITDFKGAFDALKQLKTAASDIIESRKGNLSNADKYHILLDDMIRAGIDKKLSDEEIKDQIVTLLIAGDETTAKALTWGIYSAIDTNLRETDPQFYKGMLAEYKGESDLSISKRENPRMTAFIDEILRQYTVIPELYRYVGPEGAEITVAGQTYYLPPKTVVCVDMYGIAHSESNYQNPNQFIPQRHLQAGAPNPGIYYPFGGGIHMCLGANFAKLEMKIALGRIFSRLEEKGYTLKSNVSNVKAVKGITTIPKQKIMLTLQNIIEG